MAGSGSQSGCRSMSFPNGQRKSRWTVTGQAVAASRPPDVLESKCRKLLCWTEIIVLAYCELSSLILEPALRAVMHAARADTDGSPTILVQGGICHAGEKI